MRVILIFLMVSLVQGAGNINTKSFWRVRPQENGGAVEFGASLAIKRSEQRRLLYVGAPHYKNKETNISEGAVYNCILTRSTTITCSSPTTYKYNGSMGMTMEYNSKREELTVCGNQHVADCAQGNIRQRIIGSCYVEDFLLEAPFAAACPGSGLQVDIMFLLDKSSSVDIEEFTQQLNWLKTLLENFEDDINDGRVRVGILLFNEISTVEVSLSERHSFLQLSSAISNIKKRGMGTKIGKAINATTNEFMLYGRDDAAKLMIVLTDGTSFDDVGLASKAARDNGITALAVGVGEEYNISALLIITGNQNSSLFEATDFSGLDRVTEGLVKEIEKSATLSLEGQVTNSSNLLTQCQAGTSLHIEGNTTYVGAVGAYDRAGSVFKYRPEPIGLTSYLNETNLKNLIKPVNISEFKESYLGYSTTTGHFYCRDQVLVASGAPGYKTKGAVLIYDPDDLSSPSMGLMLHPLQKQMWQLGAFFGHTVVGADLNKDSFDDLIVSAPLYIVGTNSYDQGKVFVFWNNPSNSGINHWMSNDYSPTILSGSGGHAARFGSSVVIGGDLDRNGYDDLIIGAPYEEQSPESSGVIYVYYITNDGVSEDRKQRIVGANVVSTLKRFGAGLLRHQSDANDVDDNGYPDVVASATSSNDVIVLLSRPVVVISAYFSESTSSMVNVINCLRNASQLCLKMEVIISANAPGKTSKTFSTDMMKLQISLDSLVREEPRKRLSFADDSSSIKAFSGVVSQTPWSFAFNIRFSANIFNNLAFTQLLDITPRINVSWSLATNQNTELAPVLKPFAPASVVHDLSLQFNCMGPNGSCRNDIAVTATYSLQQSATPLILSERPTPLFITVNVTNKGLDPGIFLFMNVSSMSVNLGRVDGSCAELQDVTSGVALLVLTFSSSPTLNRFAFTGHSCQFTLSYPLEPLTQNGGFDQVSILGRVYSSANRSRWIDTDETNNEFTFKRPIRYSASLKFSRRHEIAVLIFVTQRLLGSTSKTIVLRGDGATPLELEEFEVGVTSTESSSELPRSASPVNIYYNRTENTSSVGSLLDPILGGFQTNIKHSFKISNSGPHGIAKATMTIIWPAWLTSSMTSPLLYLYDFQCVPASICRCDVGATLNPFNLSQSNQSRANVSLIFPAPSDVNLTPESNCNDVHCSQINCTISNLQSFGVVTITSLYKLWLPSLTQPSLRTSLSSVVVLDTSQSLLVKTSNQTRIKVSTMVGPYIPPPPPPVKPDFTVVIIIGIVVGILLLLIAIAVAWKCGFFESKYAKMKESAIQAEDSPTTSVSPQADSCEH